MDEQLGAGTMTCIACIVAGRMGPEVGGGL